MAMIEIVKDKKGRKHKYLIVNEEFYGKELDDLLKDLRGHQLVMKKKTKGKAIFELISKKENL